MPCTSCKQSGHNKKTCPIKTQSLSITEGPSTILDVLPDISNIVDTPDIAIIRGIALEILDTLGAGHTESVYHNAMKVGLQDANLKFETERDIILRFRNRYVGTVRADIIIENRLVIELKASFGGDTAVSDALEQCRIYMKETSTPSGIVLVFPKRVGGNLIISIA